MNIGSGVCSHVCLPTLPHCWLHASADPADFLRRLLRAADAADAAADPAYAADAADPAHPSWEQLVYSINK